MHRSSVLNFFAIPFIADIYLSSLDEEIRIKQSAIKQEELAYLILNL